VERALTTRSCAEPARWPWNPQRMNRREETPPAPIDPVEDDAPTSGAAAAPEEEACGVPKDGERQAAQEAPSARARSLGGGGGEDDPWRVCGGARVVEAGRGRGDGVVESSGRPRVRERERERES
jgi:hypothetical protein